MMQTRRWTVLCAAAIAAASAVAGPVLDYGPHFVVIGDPGNRPVNQDEGPLLYPPFAPEGFRVGAVGYRYRIARTEVTVGQWLEFVSAYAPYYEGFANDSEFTSDWIYFHNGTGQYRAYEGSENLAANMGWRYAARYANCLHNGKGLDQAAFENGAYDTSTFSDNPNGTFNDQRHHNPDSLFWIPTLDEWTKAMHWDPAKNDGEGGYWRFPTSSDEQPIAGPPGVGQTNAGSGEFYDVGAYADVMSPWGLFDGSGGVREWLDNPAGSHSRQMRGSDWSFDWYSDNIDVISAAGPWYAAGGLRLVSVVPTPGTATALVGLLLAGSRRRQQPK